MVVVYAMSNVYNIGNAAVRKSANNNKLIFKLRYNNGLKKVVLMMLSPFDNFKRENF